MDIRIGILNMGRELNFETSESLEAVTETVSKALEANSSHVSLTDVKGNAYIVPTAAIGYIELGAEEARRVGFVA